MKYRILVFVIYVSLSVKCGSVKAQDKFFLIFHYFICCLGLFQKAKLKKMNRNKQ